ncbi:MULTISPECIES: hypothetical protein [Pantoea]|nr:MULTISPECIES: hypothetical protein [Pantoea]
MEGLDFFKPLSSQLDKVLPHLIGQKEVLDNVLPYYLAVIAKISGKSPDEIFGYNAKALEAVFGTSKAGKSHKERAESEYAYLVHAKVREIFDKLPGNDES